MEKSEKFPSEQIGIGSSGWPVEAIQNHLKMTGRLRPDFVITGFYCRDTALAVQALQRELRVKPPHDNGVFNAETRAKLRAAGTDKLSGLFRQPGSEDAELQDTPLPDQSIAA